jgi:hypothetical protein
LSGLRLSFRGLSLCGLYFWRLRRSWAAATGQPQQDCNQDQNTENSGGHSFLLDL